VAALAGRADPRAAERRTAHRARCHAVVWTRDPSRDTARADPIADAAGRASAPAIRPAGSVDPAAADTAGHSAVRRRTDSPGVAHQDAAAPAPAGTAAH
jgi:hypothetical protein